MLRRQGHKFNAVTLPRLDPADLYLRLQAAIGKKQGKIASRVEGSGSLDRQEKAPFTEVTDFPLDRAVLLEDCPKWPVRLIAEEFPLLPLLLAVGPVCLFLFHP